MVIPHLSLQRHGADVSPALVQAVCGLPDGVILSIAATGVFIMQKNITQGEHRCYPLCVLLNVTLQVLNTSHRHKLEMGREHINPYPLLASHSPQQISLIFCIL